MRMPRPVDPAHAWAVVAAGGSGQRFSGASDPADKLFALLGGEPVLQRTLSALLAARRVAGVVMAVRADCHAAVAALVDALASDKPVCLTQGGATRRASVWHALQAVPPEVSRVAIHDAARPLIDPALIDAAIVALDDGQMLGAVVALPVCDTLKQVCAATGTVQATVDRATLWQAQTPQVFDREALWVAHQRVAIDEAVTDDAQLLERAGLGPVRVLLGEARNLKITTRADLALAQALWQQAQTGMESIPEQKESGP